MAQSDEKKPFVFSHVHIDNLHTACYNKSRGEISHESARQRKILLPSDRTYGYLNKRNAHSGR